jgi:uncharacterized protein (TIGR03067 family)
MSREALVMAGVACVFSTFAQAMESSMRKELDELKGSWQITKIVTRGRPDDADFADQRVVITDTHVSFLRKKDGVEREEEKWIIKAIDAGKKPKAIDLQFDNVTFVPGIYKLEHRTLIICLGNDMRPETLESKSGTVTRLIELKRSAK